MAKKPPKKPRKSAHDKKREALRRFIRARGAEYLKDPNVTSIGVGHKNEDGELSLVFSVGVKAEPSMLEALDTRELPKTIEVEGMTIPTDVVQRRFEPSFRLVAPEAPNPRKVRLDPVQPGVSIAHEDLSAGTLGLVVFDSGTGAPCVLSNWHVLNGGGGQIGDTIVQPGPHDDDNVIGNECGTLLRSHLGPAGDCALSTIRDRDFEREIHALGVIPTQLADVEIGDLLVKSGRTTGITYGKVTRVDTITEIDYGFPEGVKFIGGFEIGIDDTHPPANGEVSEGGDSGSAWLIADGDDATDIFAGLHYAGEVGGTIEDERALACYPISVQKKLKFELEPPDDLLIETDEAEAFGARSGFDERFLGVVAPMPEMSLSIKRDAVNFGRAQTIPYTHFEVCLSGKRRLARFVAWNVDGARKVVLGSHAFREDPRVGSKHQLDDALYVDNALDRGHLARRADLAWGPIPEARQANRDSYFFTNIAPQHESFNRSSKGGLWGELENLVLGEADAQDIRVSVVGGPIFGEDDPEYRGALIPREFWKLIAYRSAEDGKLSAAAFVLSQVDLVAAIERIDFDPFRLFQVSVAELEDRTRLGFAKYKPADVIAHPERLSHGRARAPQIEALDSGRREVFDAGDLVF